MRAQSEGGGPREPGTGGSQYCCWSTTAMLRWSYTEPASLLLTRNLKKCTVSTIDKHRTSAARLQHAAWDCRCLTRWTAGKGKLSHVTTVTLWVPELPRLRCGSLRYRGYAVGPYVTAVTLWVPVLPWLRCGSLCYRGYGQHTRGRGQGSSKTCVSAHWP